MLPDSAVGPLRLLVPISLLLVLPHVQEYSVRVRPILSLALLEEYYGSVHSDREEMEMG